MSFWKRQPRNDRHYAEVVKDTAAMVRDREAKRLAAKRQLEIVDLTWEDTGRFKGSAVGPNISDLTIQVQAKDEGTTRLTCMPVIRYPNFSDKSADVALDEILVRVGNERGAPLKTVPLRSYLADLRRYLSSPSSFAGHKESMLKPREKEVLVSAQACFLPVPREGTAEFNPVLFNYQSSPGSPAVLAILVTREGTSATIIDNQRDRFQAGRTWGQRLFFNNNGERASLTGARLEEFVRAGGDETDRVRELSDAKKRGLNQVLLIQVPLVQSERVRGGLDGAFSGAAPKAMPSVRSSRQRASDVDEAVIGHGEVEGPFTEIDGLEIERDARFPIRVTVQFYQATSNGVVSAADIDAIAAQIEGVYRGAVSLGSLVTEGETGRSTEWDDRGEGKAEPAGWWEEFWARQERASGRTREDMLGDLEAVLGYRPGRVELEAALRRVFGGHA